MDFKNVTFYPEFWIDAIIFAVLAVVLIFVSKWLWEWKEARRLKREMQEYIQRKEDEE